jgi:Adaptin N terminal region.
LYKVVGFACFSIMVLCYIVMLLMVVHLATGVQSAAVNVVCELARKNPKNYLSLAPVFFKLMTTSTNNWMLIKIIKLVSAQICSLVLEL